MLLDGTDGTLGIPSARLEGMHDFRPTHDLRLADSETVHVPWRWDTDIYCSKDGWCTVLV